MLAKYILQINSNVAAIVALLAMAAVATGLFFLIRVESRRYKRDKILDIDDEISFEAMEKFLQYRADTSHKKVYFTLLMAGTDDFDQVREFLPPESVGEYLVKLSHVLRASLPKGGKITRLPSEESYLIYLPELYTDDDALNRECLKFKGALERKIKVTGNISVQKNASVAAVQFPQDGKNIKELLGNLSTEFLYIKKSGGNLVLVYDSFRQKPDKNYFKVYEQLKDDIFSGNVTFSFYPLYSGTAGAHPVGVSADISVTRGGKKIHYRELSKTLLQTDDNFWFFMWMLEHAVLYNLPMYRSEKVKDYFITLPITPDIITREDAAYFLQSSLSKFSIPARQVILEIFASDADNVKDNGFNKSLMEIKGVGFKISIAATSVEKAIDTADRVDADYINIESEVFDKDFAISKLNDSTNTQIIVSKVTDKQIFATSGYAGVSYIQTVQEMDKADIRKLSEEDEIAAKEYTS